jgi:hypothetical protein
MHSRKRVSGHLIEANTHFTRGTAGLYAISEDDLGA